MRASAIVPLFLLVAGCANDAPSVALQPRALCQTRRHVSTLRAVRPAVEERKADGPLEQRDPFGAFPQIRTSAHFALKAGPDRALSDATAELVLLALESAWQREIVEDGLPQPTGTERYLLNAYVGNSGGAAPEIEAAGAYVTLDPDGYPYIVIHPALLSSNHLDVVGSTIAHEFFHAVEFTIGAYDGPFETDYWFWEASAEWVAEEQYPALGSSFVGGYAMLPEVGLETVDYPDEGTLIELHHYGAAIFLRYLTEYGTDRRLVLRAWLEAEPRVTPVQTMTKLLREQKARFDERFAHFAAHTAVWDYENAATYRASLEEMQGTYPASDDHQIALELPATGTGWVNAPASTVPQHLGYNVVRLRSPPKGKLEVGVEAGAAGSMGSPAAFAVVLVRETPAGLEYIDVPVSGGKAAATIDNVGSEASLRLVVSAVSAGATVGETFPYRLRMEPAKPAPRPPAEPPHEGGCDLASGRAHPGSLAVLGLLLCVAWLRRHRGGSVRRG